MMLLLFVFGVLLSGSQVLAIAPCQYCRWIPASAPELRYLGRWTQTNSAGMIGAFADAQIRFAVQNCSDLFVQLRHNEETERQLTREQRMERGVPLMQQFILAEKTTSVPLTMSIDRSSMLRFQVGAHRCYHITDRVLEDGRCARDFCHERKRS